MIGGVITITGIHNPFLILGPAIAATGSGLLMLLDKQSNAGHWIGFQIVLGVGVGFCLTIPLMLSQVVVKTKDVSTATPIIICASPRHLPVLNVLTLSIVSQSMGSAFLLPTAQAVFQNELMKALRHFVPGLDPLVVLSAGANSEAIMSLPRANISGIVQSYDSALRYTFAIGIPFAGMALLVSFFMPWFRYHDVSKRPIEETTLNRSKQGTVQEGEKSEESKTTNE